MTIDYLSDIDRIHLPPKGCYIASLFIENELHQIGLDHNGLLCLLIQTDCSPKDKRPNIKTKYMSIAFNVQCEVYSDNKKRNEYFSVIVLNSESHTLKNEFISIFYQILNNRRITSLDHLYEMISDLFDLFGTNKKLDLKTLKGLYAELVFIYSHIKKEEAIAGWHTNNSDIYDFYLDNIYWEIKSTSKQERIHSFSNNQMKFLKKHNSLIVSIKLIRIDQGTGIIKLIELIRNDIKEVESQIKLSKLLISILGGPPELIEDISFDLSAAINSLRLINSKHLPYLTKDLIPIGISNIKYDVDVDNTSFSLMTSYN